MCSWSKVCLVSCITLVWIWFPWNTGHNQYPLLNDWLFMAQQILLGSPGQGNSCPGPWDNPLFSRAAPSTAHIGHGLTALTEGLLALPL